MFAFAIWDEREHTCFLARDPFGIKPLYVSSQGGRLLFASEVRALLASGLVPRDLDSDAMFAYFRAGSVQEPRTLLRSVRSLEAGHAATWGAGNLRARRYWDVSFAEAGGITDAAAVTREALLDSARHHFVSDVPVGIFLSGGIDSTALLATARHAGADHLHTVTLSLPGSADDEGTRARQTAAHFQTTHAELRVDAEAARALFGRYLAAVDQPSIDGLNTFAVCGFARERGLKVMLSGVGADELFGGYKSFRDVPALAALGRLTAAAGPARRAAASALGAAADPRHRRLADVFNQPPSLSAAYAAYRGIFSRSEARILAEHYAHGAPGDDADPPDDRVDPTPADAVSRLELSRYVRNQLLRDGDVMSMAFGLELRTPFLDVAVMKTVAAIPASQRLAPGKRLLVQATPGMPDGIAHRAKRCFQFPFADWLNREWRGAFADVDSTCPVPTGNWYRQWCVFALTRWIRTIESGRYASGSN
jgi:asparagine synthase (glutamine-hydrolysing)